MAAFAVSLLAVGAFIWTLFALRLVPVAQGALERAAAGGGAMLDPGLDEAAREAAVRAAGLDVLKASWEIFWRFLACLVAAGAPVLLVAATGLVTLRAVGDLMVRWDYIVGTSLALAALAWVIPRRGAPRPAPAYSPAERLVHQIAFSGPGIQRRLAALDDRLMRRAICDLPDRPPVFVTSLPRAGTTALLNALSLLPEAATHRYRDMPFVTAPLLWNRLGPRRSGRVRRRERAHGDGLEIDLDSPEAFEEALWRLCWPEKFAGDRIALWDTTDADPEAAAFFRRHFRKIVALRTGGRGRYLSKNNGNIARLAFLPAMFPGSTIIVPVRRPAAHAASLLRQHLNFARLQADDAFIGRYMQDIGHLEFGRLHRPIDFPGFDAGGLGPESRDYWLGYWIVAFETVLSQADDLVILLQDDLRAEPQSTIRALCGRLGMDSGGLDFSGQFRSQPDEADGSVFATDRLARAEALYASLAARAIRA